MRLSQRCLLPLDIGASRHGDGLRCSKADMFVSIAHTVSQRLRRLRRIPPELIPLGRCSSVAALGSTTNLI